MSAIATIFIADTAREFLTRYRWCSIPVQYGTKRPALASWTEFQRRRPTDEELSRWFRGNNQLGFVLGAASDGLLVRDFDDPDEYHRWKKAHPDLILPTVKSRRGFHVYCRDVKGRTHPRLKMPGGEMRGDGTIIIAPPSEHPDGGQYRWTVSPNGGIPAVDAEEIFGATFLDVPAAGDETHTDTFPDVDPRPALSVSPETWQRIDEVIDATLPKAYGQRNTCLLAFCRRLKAIPEIANRDTGELVDVVRRWHGRALPTIRTKGVLETLADFGSIWPKTLGDNPLPKIFEQARQATPPAWTREEGLTVKETLLAKLCVELAKANGGIDAEFFLAASTAGEFLGVSRMRACKLLQGLCALNRLKVTKPGNTGGRAHRYRLTTLQSRQSR